MKISTSWMVWAINSIKNGQAKRLENNGIVVYSCGTIIRIDIKNNDILEVDDGEGTGE